jgi:hypothetical protein
MEDERQGEKIEAVRQLLAETMGGAVVDYIEPEGGPEPHLLRVGRRPNDHRLWLGQELVEDLSVTGLVDWLKASGVPALFAETTERQILCRDSLSTPRLIDRDD